VRLLRTLGSIIASEEEDVVPMPAGPVARFVVRASDRSPVVGDLTQRAMRNVYKVGKELSTSAGHATGDQRQEQPEPLAAEPTESPDDLHQPD
jgi:hypothetical protein